jgi:hypothetical protein
MNNDQRALLVQALAEVEGLRRLHYSSGEIGTWTDKVKKLLGRIYGAEAVEVRRFDTAPGKAFIVRTETGMTEEYHRKLDCYESVMKEMIEKG